MIYDYDAGFDDPGNKNAWFARIIGQGKRILEVGCATGYVGEYLANQLGCTVVGLEYVPEAAEKARARGCYEAVLVGDIQDEAVLAPLRGQHFDCVLFGDVLEHLAQPQKALQNVRPLLAEGGHILVCVPNFVHWSIRWRMLLGKFEYTDTGPLDRTHVHFFTPATARKLARANGFRIAQEGGVVWLPSVVYRAPKGMRRFFERIAAAWMPNLAHGQVLLDLQALSETQKEAAEPVNAATGMSMAQG